MIREKRTKCSPKFSAKLQSRHCPLSGCSWFGGLKQVGVELRCIHAQQCAEPQFPSGWCCAQDLLLIQLDRAPSDASKQAPAQGQCPAVSAMHCAVEPKCTSAFATFAGGTHFASLLAFTLLLLQLIVRGGPCNGGPSCSRNAGLHERLAVGSA